MERLGQGFENYMKKTGMAAYVAPPSARLMSWADNIPEVSPYVTRYDSSSTPGRPDPAFSVDTSTFSSAISTSGDKGIRNSRQFWDAWKNKFPIAYRLGTCS